MFFVTENDIENVCKPGDVIMLNQLEYIIKECGYVMVTAFTTLKEACDYSELFQNGGEFIFTKEDNHV